MSFALAARTLVLQQSLDELPRYIESSLRYLERVLSANPEHAGQIQAKIALLQRPGLLAEIMDGAYWFEITTGRPLVTVFPSSAMRDSATRGLQFLERSMPELERFMSESYPSDRIRMWYGFIVGSLGGGGTINTEDQGTFEARPLTRGVPFNSILAHELAHGYIGNESLTQFLELYAYNRVLTNTSSLSSWVFTRNYPGMRAHNDGIWALLDVYQLIGPDAMGRAFRAVYPLNPLYGHPLPAAARQAFVDQAPTAVKSQVAAKMAMVP